MAVTSAPIPRTVKSRRGELLREFFPQGVPALWCPSITHYDAQGHIDHARNVAHLRHLSSHVKGFLIPGSTGDGWELTAPEFWELLELALDQTQKLGLHLLIGVLQPDPHQALKVIGEVMTYLQRRANTPEPMQALLRTGVCGFAVCATRGPKVSQSEMEADLTPILELGLPIALYQLPQVTQNELGPDLIAGFVERFPNFILFKDSSGADRVLTSGNDLGGVFTMRGAEGNYAQWLKDCGGPYNGFLLSTANCFGANLDRMIRHSKAGDLESARKESQRVTAVVNAMFEIVKPLTDGNTFANANKAMDHFFAHGPAALDAPPPRLHAGSSLPREVLEKTAQVLREHGLMPSSGYMKT